MKERLTKLAVNTVSLLIIVNIFSGISIDGWQDIVAVVVILTFFNIFLKPVLIVLTLPFNVVTLGLFTFIVNGFLFYLAAEVVPGFRVDSFRWAVFGSIVFGIANFLISVMFVPKKKGSYFYYESGPSLEARGRDVIDVDAEEDKQG